MDFEKTSSPTGNTDHGLMAAHPSSPKMYSSGSSSFFSTSSDEDNEEDEQHRKKKSAHRRSKKGPSKEAHEHEPVLKKMAATPRVSWRYSSGDQGSGNDSGQETNNGSGGSSGTEGGYAGSASSNEQMAEGSCSSPSVSSDECQDRPQQLSADCLRRKMQTTSSNIADFSSGDSESLTFASRFASSPSSPSSPSASSDEQDKECVATATRKRRRSEPWTNNGRQFERQAAVLPASDSLRRKSDVTWTSQEKPCRKLHEAVAAQRYLGTLKTAPIAEYAPTMKPMILLVGSDVMAHVLTFLEPPEIHDVLSMPLSKEWRTTFSLSEELWRVLCLLEPFKAKVDESGMLSDDSFDSDLDERTAAFNRHRMMYSSFVRCVKYLARIKDDAMHGRPPSVGYNSGTGLARNLNIGENRSLKGFLAKARDIVERKSDEDDDSSDSSTNSLEHVARRMRDAPIGVSDDGSSVESQSKSTGNRKVSRCLLCRSWRS
jgi:hypothetical protein